MVNNKKHNYVARLGDEVDDELFVFTFMPIFTRARRILGNLSNHDGNANENVSLIMTSKYF